MPSGAGLQDSVLLREANELGALLPAEEMTGDVLSALALSKSLS